MKETLFELPERNPVPRGPRSQRETCKRCQWCDVYGTWAYCREFDLSLEFTDDKRVTLVKDGHPIKCDSGRKARWDYA